jgi:hypothetical protein
LTTPPPCSKPRGTLLFKKRQQRQNTTPSPYGRIGGQELHLYRVFREKKHRRKAIYLFYLFTIYTRKKKNYFTYSIGDEK